MYILRFSTYPAKKQNVPNMSAKGPLRTSAKQHCVGFPLCSRDISAGTFEKNPLDVLHNNNNNNLIHRFQIICTLYILTNKIYP